MLYLQFANTNDDDETLLKFATQTDAAVYLLREGEIGTDFILTNIMDQTGTINGWEPEDFTLIDYNGNERK